jgi:hypothetical protein
MDRREFIRLFEEPGENDIPRPSWLTQLLWRRRSRQLELRRQDHDHWLARRVYDIIVGCGLTQANYRIGGGRSVWVPEVVAVDAGPPVNLNIRTLPGQTPDDFASHASTIAYHLGVTEVRVIPLGPYLIRLELLP